MHDGLRIFCREGPADLGPVCQVSAHKNKPVCEFPESR